MSYNTRRNNTGFGTPQQAASVGQRRSVSNNFVSGGQLASSQQKSQSSQQQQQQAHQQQRPQQQQAGINFRNQPQQQSFQSQTFSGTSQGQQQQPPAVKQELLTPKVQQQQQQPQQQPQQQQQQQQQPKQGSVSPIVPGVNPPPPDLGMDTSEEGGVKKRNWNKGSKISRAEKVRRRNLKLSKILQPKNAVMILNELVRGCVYTVEELPVKIDVNQFRGTVTFDGQEFAGTGRTKIAAKNTAAETALKHLVKNKQLTNIKKDEDGDEKMDIGEEDGGQVMPWSHIASFAMYKLFSTWGEDPNMVHRVTAQEIMASTPNVKQPVVLHDPKPARKMPENPASINAMMLMHQMLPNAVWDEVGKSGNPPNVLFTFRVTIDEKQFTGTGSSKKAAKKQAAFSACHDILKVNYPPDVWSPML